MIFLSTDRSNVVLIFVHSLWCKTKKPVVLTYGLVQNCVFILNYFCSILSSDVTSLDEEFVSIFTGFTFVVFFFFALPLGAGGGRRSLIVALILTSFLYTCPW